jgi:hypothetical protein
MWQRINFFLVVLLLMFQGDILGQVTDARLKIPVNYNSLANFGPENVTRLDYTGPADSIIKEIKNNCDSIPKLPINIFVLRKPVLSPSYYNNHLGFFCQKELQLQKITIVPIRFRLGSLDYVNWMEQKPNAIRPRL